MSIKVFEFELALPPPPLSASLSLSSSPSPLSLLPYPFLSPPSPPLFPCLCLYLSLSLSLSNHSDNKRQQQACSTLSALTGEPLRRTAKLNEAPGVTNPRQCFFAVPPSFMCRPFFFLNLLCRLVLCFLLCRLFLFVCLFVFFVVAVLVLWVFFFLCRLVLRCPSGSQWTRGAPLSVHRARRTAPFAPSTAISRCCC